MNAPAIVITVEFEGRTVVRTLADREEDELRLRVWLAGRVDDVVREVRDALEAAA